MFGVSASDEDVAQTFAHVAREAFAATETGVCCSTGCSGESSARAGVNPLAGQVPPIARSAQLRPIVIVVHADDAEAEYPELAAGLRRRGWHRSASRRSGPTV